MPSFRFGDEFLVNTTTENYQHSPVIEGLPNGRFVATWVDYSQSGGDTSDGAIRAQIFNADGSKFGDEFLVNTTTANSQTEPTITALATGDFVIAWTDGSQASGDTGFGVRARVFHADGTPWGADTVLPATTDNDQNMPNITGLPDGHFVAVWADANADGDLDIGIRGQVFTTDGSPASSEFHVNTTTAGAQFEPVVTALDDGHFVVAWRDGSQTGGDTSGYAIRGQVFNANGTKSGAEFLVNAITQDPQTDPVITTLANGRFVVSWSDESTYPSDPDGLSVRGQVFNANGTPSGNEFVVNTTVQGDQFHPKITALPDGNFVVSWLGTDQVYRFEHDVHAQLFTANGNAWGEEFVANIGNVSALETSLLDHTVSATADGRFVIAWEGVCEGGDDASGSAIRAQIFDARVTGITLTGTADADDFIGTDFTDLLGGWTGDDRLDGGAGNDALYDAGGNDLLIGGTGSDRAVFTGNRADYQAILLPNGDIQLTDLRAGSPDGTNTARSIEMFQFADVNVLADDLVGPANHAPVVASAIADRFSPEDASWTYQVPANTFSDQDGDPLSYSATLQNGNSLPSWLSFDTATHTFTGTPPANWNGVLDLKVTASDGTLSASDSFRLTVTAVGDAPTVANALPDASVAEDTRWTYQLPANTFSDRDGDPLSYSATLQNGSALPSWLSFDTATHTFTGTPPANWNGVLDLKVTASDGSLTASDTFRLTVTAVDDAPTVAKVLPDASVAEETPWTYQVPANTFSDQDGNPKLSYAATLADGNALPPWLTFDSATQTFAGTPPHDWTGALDLKVTASDGSLATSDTFRLTVGPVDDGPILAKALPDAAVAEDAAWTFQVPANTFSDQDGDPLSYSATLQNGSALPSWLSFDTATHTFTGAPPANWNGILDLKVSASDGTLSASDSFQLTVTAVDDAPTVANALPDASVAENTAWAYHLPPATFADADDAKLSYAATLANGHALPSWLTFNSATQTFAGTPPHDWTGALDLKVTASDGSLTASDTFRLRVTPVDDATGVTITGTTKHDRVDATHTVKGQPLPTEYDDVIRGRAFGDHLSSLGGDDLIRGGRGRDLLDSGSGNDVLRGGRGSDFLDGGSGNDLIRGGHGRDHLDGGLGDDLLLGRFGKNFLTGGSGADTFDFNSRLRESADAHHASHFSFAKITDFVAGEDRIELSHKIFPALHVGGLDADAFLSGNGVKAAHDNDDRIIYDTKSGALYYDEDGKGGAAPIEFALLRHGPDTVSYKDFLIA